MTHFKKETVLAVALTLSIGAIIVSVGTLAYGFTTFKTFRSETKFNAKVASGIEAYIAAQQAKQTPPAPTGPVNVDIGDHAVMGDANAPVTIIEFSDFQCPFCGKFYSTVLPSIIDKYVKTGKAKFVFRNFPLSFHPNARPAALASECVRELGGDDTFFKYHNKIFENQATLSVDNLKVWAKGLGIDEAKYTTCVTTEKYAKAIDKDIADGTAAGVSGTPATFINGWLISGAQPFDAFQQRIESELNKK